VSDLISKKPFVGFATSILFGALGVLLVRLDSSQVSSIWLFKIVGYFVIFVAASALFAALYAVVKGSSTKDV